MTCSLQSFVRSKSYEVGSCLTSAVLISACQSCTCVDVFQATQHLVQEELMMLRGQVIIGLDDLKDIKQMS